MADPPTTPSDPRVMDLAAAALVGAILPFCPLADVLGFSPLPPTFSSRARRDGADLSGAGRDRKGWFYAEVQPWPRPPTSPPSRRAARRVWRCASRFLRFNASTTGRRRAGDQPRGPGEASVLPGAG
jgi:Mg2+-importing ATPase